MHEGRRGGAPECKKKGERAGLTMLPLPAPLHKTADLLLGPGHATLAHGALQPDASQPASSDAPRSSSSRRPPARPQQSSNVCQPFSTQMGGWRNPLPEGEGEHPSQPPRLKDDPRRSGGARCCRSGAPGSRDDPSEGQTAKGRAAHRGQGSPNRSIKSSDLPHWSDSSPASRPWWPLIQVLNDPPKTPCFRRFFGESRADAPPPPPPPPKLPLDLSGHHAPLPAPPLAPPAGRRSSNVRFADSVKSGLLSVRTVGSGP